MSNVVVIASGPLRGEPGPFRDVLHEAGFETLDPPGSHPIKPDELIPYLPNADAIIAGGEKLDASLLALAPKLRVIARTGVGYDGVDLATASARKIAVTITPGTNHEAVAEMAFALILALAKRIVINDSSIREGGWDRTLPRPIRGQVLGLIGLGRIGRAMVPRARSFGMTVLAYDPLAPVDPALEANQGLTRLGFEEVIAASDIVSLHLPLSPGTRKLFNAGLFDRMKRGAFLINTSRGGLVDENDLVAALESGQLGGAGLDVLDREPPPADNPLFGRPEAIVCPHIAGIDITAMADMALMAAKTIVALRDGAWPGDCVVNPEIAAGWTW